MDFTEKYTAQSLPRKAAPNHDHEHMVCANPTTPAVKTGTIYLQGCLNGAALNGSKDKSVFDITKSSLLFTLDIPENENTNRHQSNERQKNKLTAKNTPFGFS